MKSVHLAIFVLLEHDAGQESSKLLGMQLVGSDKVEVSLI